LNEAAAQNFAHFSNSVKKNILVWVEGARRSETRLSRIEKTVAAAAANRNPLVRLP
jgi:uncharacterized protein YdeI (YjbR/CyaY-like superfamily)